MARKRMLDPEFFLDEELAAISAHARLLYQGLWGICDDNYATLPNRPGWIKAQIFPYESIDIRKLLGELQKVGKIILFAADDENEYWFIKNFSKHQRVEKPSKPKYPEFSDSSRRVVGDESENTPSEEKRSKEKRREEKENTSLAYLKNLPEEDLKEFTYRFDATEKQIKGKAEDAFNWLEANGKRKKNYKAYLINWLKKDLKELTDEERLRKKETAERLAAHLARIEQEKKDTVPSSGVGEKTVDISAIRSNLTQKMTLKR